MTLTDFKTLRAGLSASAELFVYLIVIQFQQRSDTDMASGSYTAEFGAGVVVNGLDLNPDATKVLVGGRKGTTVQLVSLLIILSLVNM